MRRAVLLSLLALAVVAGTSVSNPPPAQSRSLLGLLAAPLHIIRNFAIRGRVVHRHRHPRASAASRRREPPREAQRSAAQDKRGAAAQEKRAAARDVARVLPAVYWPTAAASLFGFVFAQGEDGFWAHGTNDILAAAMSPGGARKEPAAKPPAPSPACAEESKAAERAGTALYEDIEQRVQPTEAQREAFEQLRGALIAAQQRIASACGGSYASAAPPDRLDMLAERLWAMRQATLIVRTPLEQVYNSLSDEQKARLDGDGAREVNCAADLATVESWPRTAIARAVRPSDNQQAALERFRLTFAGMAQWLSSSCPQQPLASTLARLDAAGDRVNALLYATRMIRRSLGGVYAALDERQETQLQSVGRQLRPAGLGNQ